MFLDVYPNWSYWFLYPFLNTGTLKPLKNIPILIILEMANYDDRYNNTQVEWELELIYLFEFLGEYYLAWSLMEFLMIMS